MNFIRGASLDEEGKSIIVLPLITKNGDSTIVPFFKQGAGAVNLRCNITIYKYRKRHYQFVSKKTLTTSTRNG